jgi:hypothetical protein
VRNRKQTSSHQSHPDQDPPSRCLRWSLEKGLSYFLLLKGEEKREKLCSRGTMRGLAGRRKVKVEENIIEVSV